jgi:predicted house-cleaning NTP pyrophosphatase (Maf/HAM1 superfamily)
LNCTSFLSHLRGQPFDSIPESSVDALIEAGDVYYCAGGLMVEHPLVSPHVVRMDGTIDSVMGLCKATVERLLGQAMEARATLPAAEGRELPAPGDT